MSYLRILAVSTLALTGFSPVQANASDHYFTAHHETIEKPYAYDALHLPPSQKLKLREYLDYEQREPCQKYQKPPRPFVRDGCDIAIKQKPVAIHSVISDYTVYFDFDKDTVRPSEENTLANVSRDIHKLRPYEVTIIGHTDRSGDADYNYKLSQRRALAVSQKLTAMGIPNRILDQEALGETDPAVPTPDGVKLGENRRVVVQFRK